MLSSPAKRRKTSPTASIPIDASNTNDVPPERQSTPRRASYQSPTKASLARFNPGLLQGPPSRSPDKGNRLDDISVADADEIRNKRVKLFEKVAPASSTKENEAPAQDKSGGNIEPQPSPAVVPSPPPRPYAGSPSRHAEFDGIAEHANLPRQSLSREHDRRRARPVQLVDEGEPELPPTPVELGLEKKAPRPAGYFSSSSPSSRSDRRKKRKTSEGVKSSPLKPRDQRQESEKDSGVPLLQLRPKPPHSSEEVLGKQRLKDELNAQLSQLKYEVERLEVEVRRTGPPEPESETARRQEKDLISLLTSSNPSCEPATPPEPAPENMSSLLSAFLPFASASHQGASLSESMPSNLTLPELRLDNASELPYMTLFTPLTLTSTTIAKTLESHQIVQSHSITFSAPKPFKPHQFSAEFRLITNPLSQTVMSLSLNKLLPTYEHKELQGWIDQRLVSPIFKQDLGGLGWGLGRYWEGLIARAEVWKSVAIALPHLLDPEFTALAEEELEMQEQLKSLSPYLRRSSIVLRSGGNPQKALLITYTLTLSDWTADLQTEVGVCVDGFGPKVEEQVRNAFGGLLRRKGVVDAVKGLAEMVFGS